MRSFKLWNGHKILGLLLFLVAAGDALPMEKPETNSVNQPDTISSHIAGPNADDLLAGNRPWQEAVSYISNGPGPLSTDMQTAAGESSSPKLIEQLSEPRTTYSGLGRAQSENDLEQSRVEEVRKIRSLNDIEYLDSESEFDPRAPSWGEAPSPAASPRSGSFEARLGTSVDTFDSQDGVDAFAAQPLASSTPPSTAAGDEELLGFFNMAGSNSDAKRAASPVPKQQTHKRLRASDVKVLSDELDARDASTPPPVAESATSEEVLRYLKEQDAALQSTYVRSGIIGFRHGFEKILAKLSADNEAVQIEGAREATFWIAHEAGLEPRDFLNIHDTWSNEQHLQNLPMLREHFSLRSMVMRAADGGIPIDYLPHHAVYQVPSALDYARASFVHDYDHVLPPGSRPPPAVGRWAQQTLAEHALNRVPQEPHAALAHHALIPHLPR